MLTTTHDHVEQVQLKSTAESEGDGDGKSLSIGFAFDSGNLAVESGVKLGEFVRLCSVWFREESSFLQR